MRWVFGRGRRPTLFLSLSSLMSLPVFLNACSPNTESKNISRKRARAWTRTRARTCMRVCVCALRPHGLA